jgi:hypothetical protein
MRLLLALAVLAACRGDTPPEIDANPAGPRCSKMTYDLCVEEHDCDSNMCHNFAGDGFQVCTQACGAASPCPVDKNGTPGTCNGMGICKPSAPNMCHL